MIKYDKRNYRKHDERNKALIKKSLEDCGVGRSIVIDNDNSIIAGNGVYEQAAALGLPVRIIETDGKELIAVKRTDINTDDDKRKQLAVMDNSTSDSSIFDFDLLQADFEIDTLTDWGIDVEALGGDVDTGEIEEDEIPEEVQTVCKRGDIWQLGNHRLMCGDSTSPEDVALLMDGNKADIFLTDPPYNVDYGAKNKFLNKCDNGNRIETDITNDKKTPEAFYAFLFEVFSNAFFSMVDGACFYVFYPQTEYINFHNALNDSSLTVRQCLVWCKNNHVLGMNDYHYKHEPLFYGWKKGTHNWFSDRSQTTVLNFAKPLINDLHPTMKPVELICYLLKNNTRQGQSCLDLFGGSGSTLIACEQTGRKCYTMELDEHFCDVIITRFEQLTGQKAVKL